MKRIIYPFRKSLPAFLFMLSLVIDVSGQSAIPEVLEKGTLKEQMNYIEERTRIYENYRAIREDMFQQIKSNSLDSLMAEKSTVNRLTINSLQNNASIDSLNRALESTKKNLDDAIATKNNIAVLGIELNKTAYNSITWILIAALILVLAIGFLAFKRNMMVMIHTKKDLEELKNEFEEYRQKTREAREKMSMDHFNEIKRLKGG